MSRSRTKNAFDSFTFLCCVIVRQKFIRKAKKVASLNWKSSKNVQIAGNDFTIAHIAAQLTQICELD